MIYEYVGDTVGYVEPAMYLIGCYILWFLDILLYLVFITTGIEF